MHPLGLRAFALALLLAAPAFAQIEEPNEDAPAGDIVRESLSPEAPQHDPAWQDKFKVDIRLLDRRTDAVTDLTLDPGDARVMAEGNLTVMAVACVRDHQDIPGNMGAYLVVRNSGAETLFNGWMFSAMPGLSKLASSQYDIYVRDCRRAS